MKSLQKISRVLDYFAPDEPRLGLNAIAGKTGTPKTTVHRLLTSLKGSEP